MRLPFRRVNKAPVRGPAVPSAPPGAGAWRAAWAFANGSMSTHSRSGGRKVSVLDLQEMKGRGERIAALTAYDYLFARLVDQAGVDVVLVGDSLAQVVLGLDSTLPITVDDMIYHARAVRRGVERALVVVDMPFLSYQVSPRDAVRNAGRVLKETGAAAVKLEGGSPEMAEIIAAVVRAGIPVMGHVGFTPQSVNALGGFRVQGREENGRERLVAEGKRVEDAGAFAVVLELVPGPVSRGVTEALRIPTIGIGAGADCDGQVLVLPDMLGLNRGFQPRFLRRFAELAEHAEAGIQSYVSEVKSGRYPAAEHTFG
jgi:3-methyl-2-oxobutanoate hydroxymethyltransferase